MGDGSKTMVKDSTERNLGRKMHKCRICGCETEAQSWLVREMILNNGEEFEYFICDSCGCMQIASVPDDLGKYYAEDYMSFEKVEFRSFETPVKSRHKILDVGCGSGKWLLEQAEAGYGSLYGCDPFLDKDLIYGDRVWIRKCSIHEMSGDGSFAYIRMGNSFEHMTDPKEVLTSANRLLMNEGRLEISIPVFPNIAYDLFGPYWFQIDAPRHITLHSINSIRLLAEETGFEIEDIEYDSAESQILVSFFYQYGIGYKEVTWDLIKQFFSDKELENIYNTALQANSEGRGDHAVFTFKKRV